MGRLLREIENQRKELITEIVLEGYSTPSEIAKKLKGHPIFATSSEHTIYNYAQYFLKNNINNIITEESTQAKPISSHRDKFLSPLPQSCFEQVVDKIQLRIPVGAADQFARLIRVFRAEWSLLEKEALKAKEFEIKARELENHRCPDASKELREENDKLNERITFLERRIDALSSLTIHRPLDDRHLAVNGR